MSTLKYLMDINKKIYKYFKVSYGYKQENI